jgi:hypothetical protein
MKIIAISGNNAYLVQTEKDKGRVLDMNQKIFFKPFNIHSILARGYWENFTGDQSILRELLMQAKEEQ